MFWKYNQKYPGDIEITGNHIFVQYLFLWQLSINSYFPMDQISKLNKRTVLIISLLLVLIYLVCSVFWYDSNTVNLGGHFKYDKEHQFIYSNDSKRKARKDIPPFVLDYACNDDYIIVEQIPKFPLEQIYYDSNEITYPFGSNNVYYWIIDLETSDVYGPLTFEKYLEKKKDFGVPSTLRLKCEQ